MTLEIYRDGCLLLARVRHARLFHQRLFGLLFANPPGPGEGLLISPCRQVHTFGMRFAIDVAFLNHQGVIVQCTPSLTPFRMAGATDATQVLELRAGAIAELGLAAGQQLTLQAQRQTGGYERQASKRRSSQPIRKLTASPSTDSIATPASSSSVAIRLPASNT